MIETAPSRPCAETSVTANPCSRNPSAISIPRRGLTMRMFVYPIASRFSMIIPTTSPVAKPVAYPRIFIQLPIPASTHPIVMTKIPAWRSPNIQARVFLPRTTINMRSVEKVIPIRRKVKIRRAAVRISYILQGYLSAPEPTPHRTNVF